MEHPGGSTIFHLPDQPSFPPSPTGLPPDLGPRQVTLRDRQTAATIVPLYSRQQVPDSLLAYLCDQLNREIEGGDTYPTTETLTTDAFAEYWFRGGFAAVMLVGRAAAAAAMGGGGISLFGSGLGGDDDDDDDGDGTNDWSRECLGSFFIQANYPGRSSHVCTGSFIVTDGSRNRGVGRLMGEAYLEWAPRLGYRYSVFNLVYETNVASCRIWDSLGFRRIGRVKSCGSLRSYPDRFIDGVIYGRDLLLVNGGAGTDDVGEERFDKIRFYLKYGKYPNGAGRAEKSRLRSAATHYKLVEGDRLMLRDKEVVADPARQFEVARRVHAIHHGGINKTTASIAERYHWSRIKETVSEVIRACTECKDPTKQLPLPAAAAAISSTSQSQLTPTSQLRDHPPRSSSSPSPSSPPPPPPPPSSSSLPVEHVLALQQSPPPYPVSVTDDDMSVLAAAASQPTPPPPPPPSRPSQETSSPETHQGPMLQDQPASQRNHHHHHHHHHHNPSSSTASPSVLDPLQPLDSLEALHPHHHHHHHHHHHNLYHQPIDPQIINDPNHNHVDEDPFAHYPPHPDFQTLLEDDDDDDEGNDNTNDVDDDDEEAVNRDLDMLIEQDPVDEDVVPDGV
ncbi:hypothetical protein CP532_3240 [Ophiocordyceps camponoti-leonardi (nom. inval.)]|nr:hypothetical protein CP532_3240 [Ophiocordyceps camponoti-leonardi (nom. inval.)]